MSDEKSIERYDPDFDEDQDGGMHYVGMTEAEAGEYVKFVDSKGTIDALTARVAELEASEKQAREMSVKARLLLKEDGEMEALLVAATARAEAAEMKAHDYMSAFDAAVAERDAALEMHGEEIAALRAMLTSATELLRAAEDAIASGDGVYGAAELIRQFSRQSPTPTDREAAESDDAGSDPYKLCGVATVHTTGAGKP